jgi:hypothetical protein
MSRARRHDRVRRRVPHHRVRRHVRAGTRRRTRRRAEPAPPPKLAVRAPRVSTQSTPAPPHMPAAAAPAGSNRRARTRCRAWLPVRQAAVAGGGGERAGTAGVGISGVGIAGGIAGGGGSVATRLGGWAGGARARQLGAVGAPMLELRERVERAELGLGSAERIVLRRLRVLSSTPPVPPSTVKYPTSALEYLTNPLTGLPPKYPRVPPSARGYPEVPEGRRRPGWRCHLPLVGLAEDVQPLVQRAALQPHIYVYICIRLWMRCAAPHVRNCTLQCGVEGATDERATCCKAVGRRGTLSTHAG